MDRDFSADDNHRWTNRDYRVFHTSAHELENHLLDFDALADLSGCTAQSVRGQARAFAERLQWWMACKATLNDLRGSLQTGFPKDPRVPRPHESFGEPEALTHITSVGYWAGHAAALAQEGRTPCIASRVAYHGAVYGDALGDDTWVTLFSGKEIFRHLRSHVAGLDQPPAGAARLTAAQRDEDLGRRIALYFRSHQTPELFSKLRHELRNRAGLS